MRAMDNRRVIASHRPGAAGGGKDKINALVRRLVQYVMTQHKVDHIPINRETILRSAKRMQNRGDFEGINRGLVDEIVVRAEKVLKNQHLLRELVGGGGAT